MVRTEDEKRKTGRLRLVYCVMFFILLAFEIFIALYVHDDFIRPYVGDILAVIVVYCLVRIFIPIKKNGLPLFVFILAAGVEALQYFNFAAVLGLEEKSFASIVLGTVADIKDVGCYAVGCVILEIWEILYQRKKRKNGR